MKRVSSLATILVCTLGFATFSSAQTTAKEAMEEKKPILKKENSEKPSAAQKLPEGYPSQSELSPEDFESQKQVFSRLLLDTKKLDLRWFLLVSHAFLRLTTSLKNSCF